MLKKWTLTAALCAGGFLFVAGCSSPTTPDTKDGPKPGGTGAATSKTSDGPTATKTGGTTAPATADPVKDAAAAFAKKKADAAADLDKKVEPVATRVKGMEDDKAKATDLAAKAKAEEQYLNAAGDLAEIRKLYAADELAKVDTEDKLKALRDKVDAKVAEFQQKYPTTVLPPPPTK